jgi:hypothetical protein
MWVALFVSVIIYVPLFFWGRGNITVGEKFWDFRIHAREHVRDPEPSRQHSLNMIVYVIPLIMESQ